MTRRPAEIAAELRIFNHTDAADLIEALDARLSRIGQLANVWDEVAQDQSISVEFVTRRIGRVLETGE